MSLGNLIKRVLSEDWRRKAACADPWLDPDDWFPEATSVERGMITAVGGLTATERRAKSVCARCQVREPCLAEGLAHASQPGIWGGTTPRERRAFTEAGLEPQDILDKMSTQAIVYGLRKESA